MLRAATTVFLVSILAATSLAAGLSVTAPFTAPTDPVVEPLGGQILREISHARTATHPQPDVEPYADPLVKAQRVLRDEKLLGATPVDWVKMADGQRLLALEAQPTGRDLVAETARIGAAVGAPLDAAARADLAAQADALPSDLRAAFADLVGAVADGYDAQARIAGALHARLPASDEDAARLTLAERDAMVTTAEGIVAAQNLFRARVASLDLVAVALPSPLFSDPEGLVILGGLGDDTYTRGGTVLDPVLTVDLGGNDIYLTTAGGACPDPANLYHRCNALVVSVALDLDGDDTYSYTGRPMAVQGAGSTGGIGILVDVVGDDTYLYDATRSVSENLVFVTGYSDGGAQGFAQAGYGLLLDVSGFDTYRADVQSTQRSIWLFGQGFGSMGGVGLLSDATGDDAYLAYGNGIPKTSNQFQGVYTNGVGFYGGVGVQSDTGFGNDVYRAYNNGTTTDYYAQGFGAFGGLGILYEDGGNDDYTAVQVAYDPFIVPLLNCAFGTGSLGGVGIMLEMGGHDRYYGDSYSPKSAATMNEGFGGIGAAYGLLVDVSGDDGHFMEVHGASGSYTAGRGVLLTRGNMAGNYLDLGGLDTYTGAAPSRDNAQWTGGADLNLAPNAFDLFG